jgi:hypothetical protein
MTHPEHDIVHNARAELLLPVSMKVIQGGIRGPYEARHCRRAIGRQAPGRFELLGWPDKSFLILLKHPNSLGAREWNP